MIYFKDSANEIHAFDDEVKCKPFLKTGWVAISETDALAISNPPKTAEQLLKIAENAIDVAVTNKLNSTAQLRKYADIKSACAYASPVPYSVPDNASPEQLAINAIQEKQRLEGNALQTWMNLSWAVINHYYASVADGTKTMLTPDEAVAMMPAFIWPD